MTFHAGELRIFDRTGTPLGVITGFSVSGPRSYRLNDVEDFAFEIGRNDGPATIVGRLAAPTYVGASTATGTGTTLAAADPAGVQVGDILIATVGYQKVGTNASIWTPTGWNRVGEAVNGNVHGTAVFWRRVAAGDPTIRTFTLSLAGSMNIAIVAYRGMFQPRSWDWTTTGTAATTKGTTRLWSGIPNSVRLDFAATNANVTVTLPGATLRTRAGTTYGVSVLSTPLPVEDTYLTDEQWETAGTKPTATASGSTQWAILSVIMDPVYGVEQLLLRDNLVYIGSNLAQGSKSWGGYIDDVKWSGGIATVNCLGTFGLLSRITTAQIEQDAGDAGDAFTVASRLIAAANAKKAPHGDLLVGIVKDGAARELYGKFTYEGDILRGIQTLLDTTMSEMYMESAIDSSGRFTTTMHWSVLIDHDMTAATGVSGNPLVLKDGVGGNLTPGTEIDFSGAERVNFARLVGAQTNLIEHVDYDSVGNVLTDMIPVASVSIPDAGMPGARRREALDLSVDWGFTTDEQKAMAQIVQDRYLGYYKSFLYAYHDRFGAPFLDGYDWAGPEPEQTRKMASWNYRTFAQLARIGHRSVVTNFDPDNDADVSLEGWHEIGELDTDDITGIAYDYSDPRYRWVVMENHAGVEQVAVNRKFIRTGEGVLLEDDDVFRVALSGEVVRGISTDITEPGSIWVLSRSSAKSFVRRWDVTTRTPVTEWSTTDRSISDLAVDVTTGLMWTIGNATVIAKRDLNSGAILDTHAPGSIGDLVGISISGGIAYIAGPNGRIEMRMLDDGAYAGSFETGKSGLTGLFVDAVNCEVWLIRASKVTMYSASVAIAVTGGDQPVDGAPGFPKLSKGTWIRVVMSDDRIIGGSPDDSPGGVLDVHHLNQHGRYVNGKWTLWPPTHWPGGPTIRYSGNCAHTASAMLLERHTYGKSRHTPPEMRLYSGDRTSSSGMADLEKAWKRLGHDLNYTYRGQWSDVIRKLKEGRGIVLFTWFKGMPRKYRCQANYEGRHALYLHRLHNDGTIEVHDPLCRHAKNIPSETIRKIAGMYAGGNMGRATFAWSRDTTGHRVSHGKSKTVYCIWSEGKWKDQFAPGAPGEPIQIIKVWDPGEQKHGFRSRSKIEVAAPDQVIYGEEGRVSEWDPVSMGYGAHGRRHYRAADHSHAYSDGWHLIPWDVPLSTFQLATPTWTRGEEYLRTFLQRFNREQGQQSLSIINRDGLWSKIVLGGRYNLVKSLDGAHPAGIVGQIRVREFSPDEANGTMQLLCEWVG